MNNLLSGGVGRLAVVAALALAVAATAKNVDPSYRGYVKNVSVRNEKVGKTTIKQMKIRTQQYNKSYSGVLSVNVEVTDAKGQKYFGSVESPQTRLRVDNWSQADWIVELRTGALEKAEVTAYVVELIAAEKKDVLDSKMDGVKSLDELKERNKDAQKLELKVVTYDLLGF